MRGHIRERGKGRWAIVMDLGRDETGRRRQQWKTVHGTKRDAEQELTRLLHERDRSGPVLPHRTTVAEHLTRWLSDTARPRLSARSYESYAALARNHLIPRLGSLRLAELSPAAIQRCYGAALETLHPRTVRTIHTVLRQALDEAVRFRLIAANPALAVTLPSGRSREMRAFTDAEVASLLAAARSTRLFVPLAIALATGMRRNEILALRWADVDLTVCRLFVRQNLEKSRGGLGFKSPKTLAGRRSIDLPASLIPLLTAHRREQAAAAAELGGLYRDHDLIVCRPDGTPDTPSVVSRMFRDTAGRLHLPSLRFHDLRHTHATMLFRLGVHPKVVSERLGHSGIKITLDVYSHLIPALQREAAERLDDALRGLLS